MEAIRRLALVALFLPGACAPTVDRDPGLAALAPAAPGGLAAGASAAMPGDLDVTISDPDHLRVRAVGARVLAAAAEFCSAGPGVEAETDPEAVSVAVEGRGLAARRLALAPVPVCALPLTLSGDTGVNAYTDGRGVRVTRRLVRFAKHDAELAFTIAHEVAHAVIHARATGPPSRRRQQELEADHFGLYLVARAGYPVDRAARLLWRLAGAYPELNRPFPDYPSFSARFEALPQIMRELRRRRAAGRPLVPDSLDAEILAPRPAIEAGPDFPAL